MDINLNFIKYGFHKQKNAFKDKKEFEKIKRNKGVLIKTNNGVKKFPIPLFLRNKWRLNDRTEYFEILDEHARANLKRYARARNEATTKNNYQLMHEKIEHSKETAQKLDKRNDF